MSHTACVGAENHLLGVVQDLKSSRRLLRWLCTGYTFCRQDPRTLIAGGLEQPEENRRGHQYWLSKPLAGFLGG